MTKKIIVRMPNWLGDTVMATPILEDLRAHYKDASITAMCQKNVAPLLEQNPFIDAIFPYTRKSGWIHHARPHEIIEELQESHFDLGILLTNSFSSAWWFWLGAVKERVGFKTDFRSLLLTHKVPKPKNEEKIHQVVLYKHLLKPLGIPISNTPPKLFLRDEEILEAKKLLETFGVNLLKDTLIGINPGAAFGEAKCWPKERFIELTQKLASIPHVKILYFGDTMTAPLVHEICNLQGDHVINLAQKTTLRQLLAMISLCTVFLSNDSGPMHIADALATPLIALFGSTNEIKTGPYKKGVVIHKHVACSPCYKKVCPIDFRCMKQITVEEVLAELKKFFP